MRGYMKPFFKDEPDCKELKHGYRTIYCGFCRCLCAEYGVFGILSLNYELTFMILLTLSLQDTKPEEEVHSCSINPYILIKTIHYKSPVFQKAACLSILMAYGELEDDVRDENKQYHKLLLQLYARAKNKADTSWPEMSQLFFGLLESYNAAEEEAVYFEDTFAAYDAMMEYMGSLFIPDGLNEVMRSKYIELTRLLGRWLYYIDAIDDYEKDKKNKSFNPFFLKNAPCYDEIRDEMNRLNEEITEKAAELPIKQYWELVKSVLLKGLKRKTKLVLERTSFLGDTADSR